MTHHFVRPSVFDVVITCQYFHHVLLFAYDSGAAMRTVFRQFDRDGNGKIEKKELGEVSLALNAPTIHYLVPNLRFLHFNYSTVSSPCTYWRSCTSALIVTDELPSPDTACMTSPFPNFTPVTSIFMLALTVNTGLVKRFFSAVCHCALLARQ